MFTSCVVCRKTVYSLISQGHGMADNHLNFTGVLGTIGLFILVSFVFSRFFGDWGDASGPLGFFLFLAMSAVVLYVEYQKKEVKGEAGNVQSRFHQVGHQKRDVASSQGSTFGGLEPSDTFATIIPRGVGAVIGIFLGIYLALTLLVWFFCSMASGESCGVEVVFWGIGFL
jgi:hypothetical protein